MNVETLAKLPLFAGVHPAELELLLEQCTVQRHGKGSAVLRQGDPADHALLVVEGQLRAWAVVEGQQQAVAAVFKGEVVGEAALFPLAGRRTATLKADSHTTSLRFTRHSLDAMSGTQVLAALQHQMLLSTARRLRTTSDAMRIVLKRAQARQATDAPAEEEATTKQQPGLGRSFLDTLGGLS